MLTARFPSGLAPASALATGAAGGTGAPSLPMLRWANAVASIHTHYGVGSTVDVGDPLLTAVAQLVFQVAALVWQVLGQLVAAAQGGGAARFATQQIDPVYAGLGNALLGTTGAASIVVVTVIIALGLVGIRTYRQGDGLGGALRGMTGVLVPVAILVVTVEAAGGTGGATGSPSWAVGRVTGWTNTVTGSLTGLVDRVVPPGPAAGGGGPDPMADCTQYVAGLNDLYATQQAMPGAGPASVQTADSVTLSDLWQQTVMQPWIDAQFGAGALGQKAYCHLLEVQGNVSAADQVAAMQADTPAGPSSRTSGPTWSDLVAQSGSYHDPTDPPYVRLLGPDYAGGDDDLRRNAVAWAACDYVGRPAAPATGGWVIDPAFSKVFADPPTSTSCSTWWDQGTTTPPPTGGGLTVDGPFDFEDDTAIQQATTANGTDSAAARQYIEGLDGANAGQALATSIIAVVASLTYAWSLGALALGVLIGKLSLIILVACAPLFLLLAAVPSDTTRTAARRALGLTVAALVSSLLFSVLLGLLLSFISLLQEVVTGLLGTTGTLGGAAQALVPLAALCIMRRLLRLGGMASLTSLRGAVRTTVTIGRRGLAAGDDDGLPWTIRGTIRGPEARIAGGMGAALGTTGTLVTGRGAAIPTAPGAPSPGSPLRADGDRPGSGADRGPGTLLPGPAPPRPAPLPWNRRWRDLVRGAADGAVLAPHDATGGIPTGSFPAVGSGRPGRRDLPVLGPPTTGEGGDVTPDTPGKPGSYP